MGALAILAFASVLLTGTLAVTGNWHISCPWPAADPVCSSYYWTIIQNWLPTLILIGQVLIGITLISPLAIVRLGG